MAKVSGSALAVPPLTVAASAPAESTAAATPAVTTGRPKAVARVTRVPRLPTGGVAGRVARGMACHGQAGTSRRGQYRGRGAENGRHRRYRIETLL